MSNTCSQDIAILARMFAGGDKTQAEQQLASGKLQLLAKKVHAMEHTLDEIVADAQEDEVRQHDAGGQAPVFNVNVTLPDTVTMSAADLAMHARSMTAAFIACVNGLPPTDRDALAAVAAGQIVAETLANAADKHMVFSVVLQTFAPVAVHYGVAQDLHDPSVTTRH